MPCKPSTKYAYSFDTTYRGEDLNIRVYEFSEYPTALSEGALILNNITNANRPPDKFTTTENGHWIVVGFYGHHGTGIENNIVLTNMQIEVGETATSYEPYTGQTVDVQFPSEAGTVYGGTLDVTNGVLTVDRVSKLLNDPTKWATTTSNTVNFVCYEDCSNRRKTAESFSGLICSYMNVRPSSPNTTARWVGATSNNFGIKSEALTIEQIKADAADDKIMICYPLATPITYTITPQEICTLLGTNNIWADAGPVDVEYRADTKLYIDNKITQAIAAALNSVD
jgi:hypothetical protein